MNQILKTGFALTLLTISLLGLSAMSAEPVSATSPCPSTQCQVGETDTMDYQGTCALYVAGSYWSDCSVYSRPAGRFNYTCYCDCLY